MKSTIKNSDLPHCDSTGLVVQFHGETATLVDDLSKVIGTRLTAGDAAIVIAAKEHCESITEELRAVELDVDSAMAEGRYRTLLASETLSQFMVDGMPDANRFLSVMGRTIAEAQAAGRQDSGVVIFA